VSDGAGDGRLSLLARALQPAFERRVWVVPAGGVLRIDDTDSVDALVEVDQGEVELVFAGGGRLRFVRGDVLWLGGLPRRVLRNPGSSVAVLVAVSRRAR
jgi:hypothetical protein